jgi:hypothetical protein
MLKGAVEYFGCDSQTFDQKFPLNDSTREALDAVLKGYCVTGARSEVELFRGLGFHIASEISADQEFNSINAYLKTADPGLIEHLTTAKSHLGKVVYRWVGLHTFVELEHLDYAVDAALMAVKYYTGERSADQLQGLVLDGFTEFTDTLQRLVRGIVQPA